MTRPRSRFSVAGLIATGALSVLFLAGCNQNVQNTASNAPGTSTASSTGGKRYKIGFANLANIPFAVRVREGIERAAKQAGNIDLVEADNELNGATALVNAKSFVTQEVDGVIEFQTDEKFGPAIMDLFKPKKIPVIAIDIPMPGATFFGVNNRPAGRMAGEGLGRWIKQHWDSKVDALIMLELPQSGPVPAQRLAGEREGLESIVGKIPESSVKHLDSKNTTEMANRLIRDGLSTLPQVHHIAIVCINDDTAVGAINAARAVGRENDIAVTAVDGSEVGRREIRKPNSPHKGSTASFPEKYGDKIIPAMLKLLKGEKLPPVLYTDHVFLTRENVDKYYPNDPK
jgi:ribose transport system substrate-binding protein